jgi:hypothetical protein
MDALASKEGSREYTRGSVRDAPRGEILYSYRSASMGSSFDAFRAG